MKPIIASLCIVLLCISCKKNHVTPLVGYQTSAGELIGYDMRMCPEPDCGGMIIHIDNDTSNAAGNYHYNGNLSKLGFSDNTAFPVNVTLTWKRDTGVYGSFGFIVIGSIKRR